ncbi:MAG: hypothetical protein OXL97_04065 [Chloroflexota bacterium]|nr:hypothetical protein [Chloroflexota bacterium]MDE2883608.1 hypothetical protein [Chloroflexota bacterium]
MARDGFQLVQEAVSNWESLDGVAGVEVVQEWLGNTSELGFMAKVTLEDEPEPFYIQLTLVDPHERMEYSLDDDLTQEQFDLLAPVFYEARFREKPPVRWRDEPWE